MARKYEVTVITGKYKGADGKERSRYMNVGSIMETKNGPMLKMDAVPVNWDGWAYLNEPKPKDEEGPP